MTLFGKIIAGVLITGGALGAVYFMTNSNPGEPSPVVVVEEQNTIEETTQVTASSSTEAAPTGKKMAFSQFMKTDKGSYVCEVNQSVGGVTSKGKVYLSKGNIRGDFATSAAGQNITSSMVMKDGYSYTWTSMSSTMGFKVKLPTEAEATTGSNNQGSASAQASYAWNGDTIGDYSCEVAVVEDSRFALPATINFTEVTR